MKTILAVPPDYFPDPKSVLHGLSNATEPSAVIRGETVARFSGLIYGGSANLISGYKVPVVIDLEGLKFSSVLVAFLDGDIKQRVGQFEATNDGRKVTIQGWANAGTEYESEVVGSARNGFKWYPAVYVTHHRGEHVASGKVIVNGQTHEGPLVVVREGTLKGISIVDQPTSDIEPLTFTNFPTSTMAHADLSPICGVPVEGDSQLRGV